MMKILWCSEKVSNIWLAIKRILVLRFRIRINKIDKTQLYPLGKITRVDGRKFMYVKFKQGGKMTENVAGSMSEIAAANRVYGVRLVEDGVEIRVEVVTIKDRFHLIDPDKVDVIARMFSNGDTIYKIMK